MTELRWTLLIIGVLFLVILFFWERRRPHQASRQSPHISGEPRPLVNNDPSWGPDMDTTLSTRVVEPPLSLPEMHAETRVREVSRELPVVEIPEDLHDEMAGPVSPAVLQPAVLRPVSNPAPLADGGLSARPAHPAPAVPIMRPIPPVPPALTARPVNDEPPLRYERDEPEFDEPMEEDSLEEPIEDEAIVPLVEPTPAQQAQAPVELPPPMLPRDPPLLEWPPEDQRKLVSLRLVARPPDRFQGRLVRQALSAEGFVLGPLDIFHKPDAQNRSVLSAASLTNPGTFDLETMDTQRYSGLNLFAVLPGPRSPQKAFEDLLTTARMLNERLEGALQDDRGGPLTPTRIQILRDSLGAEAKS